MKFWRLLVMFLLSWAVSAFLFPFGLVGLPESLNLKQVLAVIGVPLFAYECFINRRLLVSRYVLTSFLIATVFSLWCLFCLVVNHTTDTSYSQYIVSFFIWLFGAYAVVWLLRSFHGRVDLKLLTNYLVFVCVMQLIIALMIDSIPSFKSFIDARISQGADFLTEVNRLYGIGASLDPSGVRFALVLVLLAHQITQLRRHQGKTALLVVYIIAFCFITVVGSVMSRTTGLGTGFGIAYMLLKIGLAHRGEMTRYQEAFYLSMIAILALGVALCGWLYTTNQTFYNYIRYGFEPFVKYFEKGTFQSDSWDKLNKTMWIWPETSRQWAVGRGLFDNFVFGTDIGYCRFVLYCGLPGMILFGLFALYNCYAIAQISKGTGLLAVMMMMMQLIIWVKVSTDIFWLAALFLCIGALRREEMIDERGIKMKE